MANRDRNEPFLKDVNKSHSTVNLKVNISSRYLAEVSYIFAKDLTDSILLLSKCCSTTSLFRLNLEGLLSLEHPSIQAAWGARFEQASEQRHTIMHHGAAAQIKEIFAWPPIASTPSLPVSDMH